MNYRNFNFGYSSSQNNYVHVSEGVLVHLYITMCVMGGCMCMYIYIYTYTFIS